MRKLTCEPGTELNGGTVRSVVENLTTAEYDSLIREYGYENVDPDQWYPLQDYLNFLTELVERPNLTSNLVAIGLSVAEVAPMPPQLENADFSQIVEGWNQHYQASFRNASVGQKTTIKVEDQHYKIVHEKTIAPDDLEYGVLYGFAKRFLPTGVSFTVWYDEDVPRMDEGGEQTIIHVKWG